MPIKDGVHFSEDGEEKRQAVNDWIRTSGEYDGWIDFDAATRDPEDPSRFRLGFSPDNLHPSDAGFGAMVDSIDLSLFED